MLEDNFILGELLGVTGKLNAEITDQIPEIDPTKLPAITVSTDGTVLCVQFLGTTLWNSDTEDRAWDDEADSYEPMEPYLRRKLNELLSVVSKLKF